MSRAPRAGVLHGWSKLRAHYLLCGGPGLHGAGAAGPGRGPRRAVFAGKEGGFCLSPGQKGRARPGHAVVAAGWGANPARIRAAMAGLTLEQAIVAGRSRSDLPPPRLLSGFGFRNAPPPPPFRRRCHYWFGCQQDVRLATPALVFGTTLLVGKDGRCKDAKCQTRHSRSRRNDVG